MSLRDEAITHMSQAIVARQVGKPFAKVASEQVWAASRLDGFVALDALLDFLDAHTEEWEDDADVEVESSVKLVAALRGDNGRTMSESCGLSWLAAVARALYWLRLIR